MRLKTCCVCVLCSECGTSSRKVHSRYIRHSADLPQDGVPVVICLCTRSFSLRRAGLPAQRFTEPLPGTMARYGRRNCWLSEALRWLTLAPSRSSRGEALRAVLACWRAGRRCCMSFIFVPSISCSSPTRARVDDWAWREGHRYGAILWDLETRKVIRLDGAISGGTAARKPQPAVSAQELSATLGRLSALP